MKNFITIGEGELTHLIGHVAKVNGCIDVRMKMTTNRVTEEVEWTEVKKLTYGGEKKAVQLVIDMLIDKKRPLLIGSVRLSPHNKAHYLALEHCFKRHLTSSLKVNVNGVTVRHAMEKLS